MTTELRKGPYEQCQFKNKILKIYNPGPTVTKISNPLTKSSTQYHKKNVQTFDVKTQTYG